ncbi:MAG: hypothetical protein GYA24_09085 [Candidatus Lokiarchaeota archaeon]|nr:hypothetical protein [Candidatus Lokiarchaeota archaeon]
MNGQDKRLRTIFVSYRDLMRAMDDLPRAITAPDSPAANNKDLFFATFCDFLSDVLGVVVPRDVVKGLIDKELDAPRMQFLLVVMGFLASGRIFPAARQAIAALASVYDVPEYLLKELFLLSFYMAKVVTLDAIVMHKDRKEEVARKVLAILGVGIEGESIEESASILEGLDSIEIQKLSSELEVIIRKQISDRLAAEAAAAKPSRE